MYYQYFRRDPHATGMTLTVGPPTPNVEHKHNIQQCRLQHSKPLAFSVASNISACCWSLRRPCGKRCEEFDNHQSTSRPRPERSCERLSMMATQASKTRVFTATWPSYAPATGRADGTRGGSKGHVGQQTGPFCQVQQLNMAFLSTDQFHFRPVTI